MSRVWTSETWDNGVYNSPQASLALAMQHRRPWVLAVSYPAEPGDMILFPDFFFTASVLRYAREGELKFTYPWAIAYVVCAEPPEEQKAKRHRRVWVSERAKRAKPVKVQRPVQPARGEE